MESQIKILDTPGVKFLKYVYIKDFFSGYIFSETDEGHWLAINDTLPYSGGTAYLSNSILKEVGMIENKDYDLKDIKKLYIHRSALIPRYKLKEAKEKYDFSIVRNVSDSDHVVVNKHNFSKLFTTSYSNTLYLRKDLIRLVDAVTNSLNRDKILALIKNSSYEFKHKKLDLELLQAMKKDLESFTTDYALLNWTPSRFIKELIDNLLAFDKTQLEINLQFPGRTVGIIDQDTYHFIQTIKDKVLVEDSVIQANLGATILSNDDYLFIDKLLDNEDETNIELGLTMMANSNFNENAHYLMLLLENHFQRHRYKKYTKSVAFQSMLSFLKVTGYSITFDQIIRTSVEIGKFEGDFKNMMIEILSKQFKVGMISKYIKAVHIELDEEKLSEINNNVASEQIPDTYEF